MICCKKFVTKNKNNALRCYLNKLDISSIKLLLGDLKEKEILVVISCLPLKQEIVDLVSETEYEKFFWENVDYYRSSNVSEDTLFEQFIKYKPLKLLSPYAYIIKNKSYERGIRLLEAVAKESQEGFFEDEHYSLEHIVEEMDSLYYKEELSEIEIQLLPHLKRSMRDYPLGVKRLFWANPSKFVNFLKDIYTNKDNFKEGSIGHIYYEMEYSFGFSCFIPKDYLVNNAEELNRWFYTIMNAIHKEDKEFVRFVKKIIASTFSNCPSSSETFWPTLAVANLLEKIADDTEDPYDLSSSFATSFINSRGAITIDDGTAEFAREKEFRQYADYYSETHKVTAKALRYIADSFKTTGESFKNDLML